MCIYETSHITHLRGHVTISNMDGFINLHILGLEVNFFLSFILHIYVLLKSVSFISMDKFFQFITISDYFFEVGKHNGV